MSIKRTTVEERKGMPLASGVLDYFPDALLVVAEVSRVGNEQHHPGQPLHWDKSKSTDEADALLRHLVDRGTLDTDGLRHSGKVAWRALALLQRELDAEALKADVRSTLGLGPSGIFIREASLPPPRCAYCAMPQGSGHTTMCPLYRHGFRGYGGTGDPATRSDNENAVYASAMLPDPEWHDPECPCLDDEQREVCIAPESHVYFSSGQRECGCR